MSSAGIMRKLASHILPVLIAPALLAGALLGGTTPVEAQTTASAYTSGVRFDKLGRQVGTIAPDPDDTGSLKYAATRTSYDAAGRQVKVEIGELSTWQATGVAPSAWTGFTVLGSIETSYDALDRKIKVLSKGNTGTITSVTQYSYDSVGLLECTTQRMNSSTFSGTLPAACTLGTEGTQGPDRITKNFYDPSGDLLMVKKAFGVTVANGFATTLQQDHVVYTYTDNGKRASVKDANGNLATMTYDGHDRQTRWTFPSKTITGSVDPADYEEYAYDANGNRTSLRKRDGSILTYTYDVLNRMTVKDVDATNVRTDLAATHKRDVFFGYDLRGLQLFARFDGIVTTNEGLTTVYDGFGRVLSNSLLMDTISRQISYQFDKNGNRTQVKHPDFKAANYNFDGLDRVKEFLQGATSLGTITYNTRGLRKTLTGGVATGYSYDSVGRLSSIGHDLGGATTIHDVTYSLSYNPVLQAISQTTSNDGYVWTGGVNVNRAYAVNGLNQYTSAGSASFTYDLNGNLTSDGSNTYLYDVENRLVSATGATSAGLRYDPMGRLYETTGAVTTRFLYDGDELISEYNTAGTILRRYVHGPGSDDPLVWFEGSGVTTAVTRRLRTNPQGSITSIADNDGTNIGINAYDDWGIPQSTNIGRFQYTGQILLPELGMYHYKARIYSPTLGRFLQVDPIGYDDQINLYTYVGNDPVNITDPSGMAGDSSSKRGTPESGCGSRIKGVNNCSGQSGADYQRASGDQAGGSKGSKKGNRSGGSTSEITQNGPVVTLGVALDFAVIGGGTLDGGVTVDLADGDVGTYGSVTAVAGVDISVSVQVGVYENAQALVGEFQEIEAGILAGAASGVLDTDGGLIGGTASLGLGLPASGRYSNGQGDIFGESEGKTKESPIVVNGKRTFWQKVRNFFGF